MREPWSRCQSSDRINGYDSFNPVEGDFGFNWTYAINDMDVVIDEDRQTLSALESLDHDTPLDKSAVDINVRVNGGRNITLTLPDGTRTTFRCRLSRQC